ncbi:hypothetical protein BDR26DRAFT_849525 [Obelidium mucronatum]|nr:hypothetical protein BDR26DRAFT_849525 [Obelidium mucronatum]
MKAEEKEMVSRMRILVSKVELQTIAGPSGESLVQIAKEVGIHYSVVSSPGFITAEATAAATTTTTNRTTLSPKDDVDRVLQLSGPLDCIAKGISMMADMLSTHSRHQSGPDKPPVVMIRLLIEQDLIPHLIGVNGRKVNQIRDDSGLMDISVGREALVKSTEYVLYLSGVTDAIQIGCYEVGQLVRGHESDVCMSTPYRPVAGYVAGEWKDAMMPKEGVLGDPTVTRYRNREGYQISIPSDLVGYVIGKRGMHVNGICQRSGARIIIRDEQFGVLGGMLNPSKTSATISVTGGAAGSKEICNLAMFMVLGTVKRGTERKEARQREQEQFEKDLRDYMCKAKCSDADLRKAGLFGFVNNEKRQILAKLKAEHLQKKRIANSITIVID